jgi:hypothetical protein
MCKALFNKISIVESLRESDRKTGNLLFEDINIMEVFHQKGVATEYVAIATKKELFAHIDHLIHDAKYCRIFPILQIDVHGTMDRSGIILNSGDRVIWRNLCDKLRDLNELSRGNLIVVMAACYGAHIQTGIDLFNRSPFWGVMSPVNSVTPDAIQKSLSEFYLNLFEGSTRVLVPPNDAALKLTTADSAFLQFWKVTWSSFSVHPS